MLGGMSTARLVARPEQSSKAATAISCAAAAAPSPAGANGYQSGGQFVSHALKSIKPNLDNSSRYRLVGCCIGMRSNVDLVRSPT
jgi:hypothetical protein